MNKKARDDGQVGNPLTFRSTMWWQILVLAAISVPYLLAWLTTPEDKIFSWALLNPDDMGVYVSAMNQGADGSLLYHFTYSPEPWQPRLMYMPYLLMGFITSILASPSVVWLHFWRLVVSVMSMNLLIFWFRTVFPEKPRWQWTSWFIILFGGGLGWAAAILAPSLSGMLPDIGLSEWMPLLALFNTPHFALGLGLMSLVFSLFIRADRAETSKAAARWAILGAVAAISVALTYAFLLVVIVLVLGTYLVIQSFRLRWKSWRHWWIGGIFLAPLLPILYYYGLWNSGDPYWEQYSQVANVILPPAFWAAIIGMGLLLPFTIAGFYFWFKRSRNLLIPIWAVVNFMALYFPFFIFSGRFALGLFIPIASLAAVGLEVIILPWLARTEFFAAFSRLTPTPYATLRRVILLLLIPSALMAILLFTKGPLVQKEFPYYWPEADVQAAKWLGEVSSEKDVTLAYYPMGNFLPQVYPGKVFMGQKFLTTNLDMKLEQYEQFWDGSMSGEEMQEFLHLWGISYIFSGTYEKPFRMDTALEFPTVYSKDGVEIYSVP